MNDRTPPSSPTKYRRIVQVCEVCSDPYWIAPSRAKNYKTCSPECQSVMRRMPHKEPGEKNCEACGKSFVPKRSEVRFCSKSCGYAIRPKGKDHHFWKGDDVTYKHVHAWVSQSLDRTGFCQECGVEGRTDFSNVDHQYRRDLSDWRELCKPCHARYDKKLRAAA